MDNVLTVNNLTMDFGGIRALNGVDLRVEQGQIVALIGPNGAGKTTFFNLLAGLMRPSAGKIAFEGHDVTRESAPHRVHLGIAKAFQTANLYPEQTVLQNCRLAALARMQGPFALEVFRRTERFARIDEQAREALERVDLAGMADVRAGDLAHGDKKLLDIAIALATQPKIILLDEPVAGMSKDEARKTAILVRRLTESMTVLIIEHDIDLVMGICDSITVLHQGHVLANGTPAAIRANPFVQEAYLGGHSVAELAG
jgi:ABC-type branched-subunit amino acid transport system ATPase component